MVKTSGAACTRPGRKSVAPNEQTPAAKGKKLLEFINGLKHYTQIRICKGNYNLVSALRPRPAGPQLGCGFWTARFLSAQSQTTLPHPPGAPVPDRSRLFKLWMFPSAFRFQLSEFQ
ncbi:MAG TPA: hypothetical protein VFC17_07255, partial [Candidatus Limnocylindrales bacterium]|nr:hypothetical protein [Candidatus Limnocylindrales bacterium]